MRYRWLLLDADGTLFDYDRAEAWALGETFAQAGHSFPPETLQAYRRINGRIWRELELGTTTPDRLRVKRFELLFADVAIEADPATFSQRYVENLAQAAHLMDGAEETVRALHGKVGLAVITNGLKDVQRARLARSAVGRYLDPVVISEEAGAAKPDPQIFDAAFELMGHPTKDQVLIVGDSLTSDIQGGNQYGIDTCWFNPGRSPRDPAVDSRHEIAHLSELVRIVGAT